MVRQHVLLLLVGLYFVLGAEQELSAAELLPVRGETVP